MHLVREQSPPPQAQAQKMCKESEWRASTRLRACALINNYRQAKCISNDGALAYYMSACVYTRYKYGHDDDDDDADDGDVGRREAGDEGGGRES